MEFYRGLTLGSLGALVKVLGKLLSLYCNKTKTRTRREMAVAFCVCSSLLPESMSRVEDGTWQSKCTRVVILFLI